MAEEKKLKQKTVKLTLRDSGPPFDLDKYQKITVPQSANDEDTSSCSGDSEEQENDDSDEKGNDASK